MVYGGLRSARWLRNFKQGPIVSAFRNLETGQVLFSQTLHPQQFYIDQQFKWPNWQNKKPTTRKDIWRPLAVTQLPTWDLAVQLYKNIVQLRDQRDWLSRKQANDWRRKNSDGNIWFWNQYRPTYSHEAVADLLSAIEAINPSKDRAVIIHWDHLYRKGPADIWKDLNVQHLDMMRHNPREQFVLLNEIRSKALEIAEKYSIEDAENYRMEQENRKSQGLPTDPELKEKEIQEKNARSAALKLKRQENRSKLLESRPDLKDLSIRAAAVREAAYAVKEAEAAFDPYTPRGQRGLAKQPIKLRKIALRQAKRSFRELKRRIARSKNKRMVKQLEVRLQLNRKSLQI